VQDAGVPGTGLGLAMVREIAELHGGSVAVRSEVGAGSTFTLRIPRKEPPA
jgi:signal transduction histidine kinase